MENRFLMVPLSALPKLTKDNIVMLFDYCIVLFAGEMNITLDNSVQEVLYDWYHNKKNLTNDLHEFLLRVQRDYTDDWVLSNDDYQGFNGEGEFDPGEEADLLRQIIIDNNMDDEVKQYAAIKKAQGMLLANKRNVDNILSNHSQTKPSMVFGKVPVDVFWMLIKGEVSIEAFKMYAAIKSIEGRKKAALTTKHFINTRMLGEISKTDKPMPSRRHTEMHMKELMDLNLVSMIPGGRCWHVSTNLSRDELSEKIADKERKRRNTLIDLQKKHPQLETIQN